MSPKAEGDLWNSRGRSPREFYKPPEGEGHLITNFQNIMVLVCNTMVKEGIARGVLPVLNAV
jgi:hypothetical protein